MDRDICRLPFFFVTYIIREDLSQTHNSVAVNIWRSTLVACPILNASPRFLCDQIERDMIDHIIKTIENASGCNSTTNNGACRFCERIDLHKIKRRRRKREKRSCGLRRLNGFLQSVPMCPRPLSLDPIYVSNFDKFTINATCDAVPCIRHLNGCSQFSGNNNVCGMAITIYEFHLKNDQYYDKSLPPASA